MPLLVKVNGKEFKFAETFVIGRGSGCDLQIPDDWVSRKHAVVEFDGQHGMVRDLGSANGTYVDGEKIEKVPLYGTSEVQLGGQGPIISVVVQERIIPEEKPTASTFLSETQIIQHYFSKKKGEEVGDQTMMFMRAFESAVGPNTRCGYAKGIWQFITLTAHTYGLEPGPMYETASQDPLDDRFYLEKAAVAAGNYLRDFNTSEAEASGLLVLASYNWGEGNIVPTLQKMPQSPRERNFWKLLARKDIPKETHDYVFYIFSHQSFVRTPTSLVLTVSTAPASIPSGQGPDDQ